MKDRINLTREENIFLARKKIYENIYSSAKLEGCDIMLGQTKSIIDGIVDSKISSDTVQIILNLKDAWDYILKNIDEEINTSFILEINKRVSKNESLDWGVLRYGEVSVSLKDGTSYRANIPKPEKLLGKLSEIQEIECITERALNYYTWAVKSQLFWDGNKRTSNLIANAILIQNGKGILNIEEKSLNEFHNLLSCFYKTNDNKELHEFLYKNCIKE